MISVWPPRGGPTDSQLSPNFDALPINQITTDMRMKEEAGEEPGKIYFSPSHELLGLIGHPLKIVSVNFPILLCRIENPIEKKCVPLVIDLRHYTVGGLTPHYVESFHKLITESHSTGVRADFRPAPIRILTAPTTGQPTA